MALTAKQFLGLGPHGFHRMHYSEWGARDNPRVLVCVHGLTRTGRDFDFLAQVLEADYRVICPDIVGRGQSGWLSHKADYNYTQYVNDMVVLLGRSGAAEVDWLGTSMGGLIGMILAAQPGSPIRRLIMNDVGPFIPKAGLERIAQYVGKPVKFNSLADIERYLRLIAAPFGPLTDVQWRHLTEHSVRRLEDGSYTFAYDPGIAEPFKQSLEDVNLWPIWNGVRCPVLVIRGAQSDVLTREDAETMATRPDTRLVEFSGIGHAPALMSEDQIALVKEWLGEI